MTLVVDASVIVAWMLREERSAEADAIARRIVDESVWVPQLFPIEIGNVLIQAVRRQRITQSYANVQLRRLEDLSFSIDGQTADHVWTTTYRLATDQQLTLYDATYLELALRLGAELATLDGALSAAARRRGLAVLP